MFINIHLGEEQDHPDATPRGQNQNHQAEAGSFRFGVGVGVGVGVGGLGAGGTWHWWELFPTMGGDVQSTVRGFKPILYLAKITAETEGKVPDGGWTGGFIKSLPVL